MPGRRATPRTRYDGAAFRDLRERHNVDLYTLLHTANQRFGFEVSTHEHVRQWERGQRNISDRLASQLALALTTASGTGITPDAFVEEAAAA